jgi:hypothetical protein
VSALKLPPSLYAVSYVYARLANCSFRLASTSLVAATVGITLECAAFSSMTKTVSTHCLAIILTLCLALSVYHCTTRYEHYHHSSHRLLPYCFVYHITIGTHCTLYTVHCIVCTQLFIVPADRHYPRTLYSVSCICTASILPWPLCTCTIHRPCVYRSRDLCPIAD